MRIPLTSAGIENPTVKWLLDKFRSFILTVNSVFFVRYGFKKTILVGMLAWAIRYALFAYGNGGDLSFMLIIGIAYTEFVMISFLFPVKYIPTQKRVKNIKVLLKVSLH
jgi:hypothetical protein